MKQNFLLLLSVIAILGACNTQPEKTSGSFTLTGSVEGKTYGTIALGKFVDREFTEEFATEMVDGNFQVKGEIDQPEMYYFQLKGIEDYQPVFIEASEIQMDIVIDSSEFVEVDITGSVSQDTYDKFYTQLDPYDSIDKVIYQVYYLKGKEEGDEEMMQIADSLWEDNQDAKKELYFDFVSNNPGNVVPAFVVLRNSYMFDLDDLDVIVSEFDESISTSEYVKNLTDRLAVLKRVDIGQPIVDFTMMDTAGHPISLSDLTGKKYLLMDFWASWCGPCRAENPNVVAVYNDYKDKGFDVIGISLDRNKEKWVEAIAKDDLTWTHVSDLIGWDNASAKLYGVRSIPHSILVSPDGIILAKNLRGEDLRAKVSELLD